MSKTKQQADADYAQAVRNTCKAQEAFNLARATLSLCELVERQAFQDTVAAGKNFATNDHRTDEDGITETFPL